MPSPFSLEDLLARVRAGEEIDFDALERTHPDQRGVIAKARETAQIRRSGSASGAYFHHPREVAPLFKQVSQPLLVNLFLACVSAGGKYQEDAPCVSKLLLYRGDLGPVAGYRLRLGRLLDFYNE